MKDSSLVTIEVQIVKFLHILAHSVKNKTMSFFFHRSRETISHYLQNILRAIISLEKEFLLQPSGLEVPSLILNSERFYHYFKVM